LVVSFAIRSEYGFLNFAVKQIVRFDKKSDIPVEKKKE
jgi:hypothetical protein